MLDFVLRQTDNYLDKKTKSERKRIGQFFTSKETAIYMASLFSIPNKSVISILDPGAGSGILSVALIEQLQKVEGLSLIRLTCYENDLDTITLLENNLRYAKEHSIISLEYIIITDNYITSQCEDFQCMIGANMYPNKFDLVIGNPPYVKIPKDALEATSMPQVCYGAPNLYFLFTSMGLFNLSDSGEMVFIIPRSWTSGAYFKAFRNYLLSEGKLLHMHLFVSRDKVFDKEKVLQETMIIKLCKQKNNRDEIEITSSTSNNDFHHITTIKAPYSTVVTEKEKYVFLATTQEELLILNKINKLKCTLPSIGLKMKTGLTVDFRNRDQLRETPEDDVIPLFFPQHIVNGRVVFPVNRQHEYISNSKPGLIQKNKNYLFIKRFTSKEEKRRLQCGIYLSNTLIEYKNISTQNKINFIDHLNGDELSEEMIFGLYTIFNSTIYDKYYRILNGSTQVNATEINATPIPTRECIIKLGKNLMQIDDFTTESCDKILEEII